MDIRLPEYPRQGSYLIKSTDPEKPPHLWKQDAFAVDQEGLYISAENSSLSINETFPRHSYPDKRLTHWVPTRQELEILEVKESRNIRAAGTSVATTSVGTTKTLVDPSNVITITTPPPR